MTTTKVSTYQDITFDVQPKQRILKIEDSEVILFDYEHGHGKIIITTSWGWNFSYEWGSMGSDIFDFIKDIDSGYFSNKLKSVDDRGKLNINATLKNVRAAIKEELEWYKDMEFQKELRGLLNELKSCETVEEFVSRIDRIPDKLNYDGCSYEREKTLKRGLNYLFNESWYFAETGPSDQELFLIKVHKKLKKIL